MITAKIIIKAELTNPPGEWEMTHPVEFPEGHEKAIILQMVGGVHGSGLLVKTTENGEPEFIPTSRVVKYHASINKILTADNFDLAAINARQPQGKVTLS